VASVAVSVARERIEALRPLAEAIVAAAVRRDVLAYVEADNDFHLALLALAGNEHLVEVVRDLRYRSRLYGVPGLAARNELEPSARQHIALLDAVSSGDPEVAAQSTRDHLAHIRGLWARMP
jgi:DNA-binding GntR family transcriptional regulator